MTRKFFDEIKDAIRDCGSNQAEIHDKAGFCRILLWKWRTGRTRNPSLFDVECLLETMEYELTIRKVRNIKFQGRKIPANYR